MAVARERGVEIALAERGVPLAVALCVLAELAWLAGLGYVVWLLVTLL
ncbi:MAG TPA: hypothetical protein VFU56_09885 [Gaiellaceae bacterium]|nr:hypothetical protein [Gaiellaceae bacterium]